MPDLKVSCPGCGCPDQHVGMPCGFCNKLVPVPAEALAKDGTAKVEEVIGWRAWQIVRENGRPRLASPVVSGHVWQPGGWEIAECHGAHGTGTRAGRRSRSSVAGNLIHASDATSIELVPPVVGCGGSPQAHGCGFYAGRTHAHLISMHYGNYHLEDTPNPETTKVIGKVQMAGKIIPATNGWRAQKVRPRVIYVPYEYWQLAADLKADYGPYGVEVDVATTIKLQAEGSDLPQWCPHCTAAWQGRTTTCEVCGYTLQ